MQGDSRVAIGKRLTLKLLSTSPSQAVTALIESRALDANNVVLWVDWFSIDQVSLMPSPFLSTPSDNHFSIFSLDMWVPPEILLAVLIHDASRTPYPCPILTVLCLGG